MQVRLTTPVASKFGARLSFDELESRRDKREELAAPLTQEARAAAKIKSERTRKASLVSAAIKNTEAEIKGVSKISRLRKIAAQRRWKHNYRPRINGIF